MKHNTRFFAALRMTFSTKGGFGIACKAGATKRMNSKSKPTKKYGG